MGRGNLYEIEYLFISNTSFGMSLKDLNEQQLILKLKNYSKRVSDCHSINFSWEKNVLIPRVLPTHHNDLNCSTCSPVSQP